MISVALRNPYLVVVLALLLLVLGVVCYTEIPADLLPIFETPAVQIVTFYPGMPPEVMERDIMSRLERWTGQSVGISHQEGKAMLGVCVVKDFFREGISLDTAMSQVTSYAMSDMFYLPPGTIPPMVMPFDPTASLPLALVSVSSPTMDEQELYDVAYFELRNRLQSIQGVIAPAVYGGVLRRILAYVDPEKLQARRLSPLDVVTALRQFNVFIPAGDAKFGNLDYQIFTNAIPSKVEEMNSIPIKVVDGKPVLIGDIGKVVDSHQIQSNIVRVNGRRQVYIPIYRQPGANTIEIVDAIKDRLQRILQRIREMDPRAKTLQLEVVMDQSVYVRDAIKGLQLAAGLGAVLAALVVFLFLRNFRLTFIIFLAIPLSILAALMGLFYSGDTINAMTLGGLALAVGILVDQSIVVLENTMRHYQNGKGRVEAATEGVREVAWPVLVSTITLVVVFYPVVFLSGLAKYLFTPLALAATFAIGASYLIAVTLIPSFCARFLGKRTEAQGTAEEGGEGVPGGFYPRVLGWILRLRYPVVVLAIFLVAFSFLLLNRSGSEMFPRVDAGQFSVLVRLPAGTRIENTEQTIAGIEEAIMEVVGQPDAEFPQVERYPDSNLRILISNIGVLMDWPAAYTPNTGPMDAFVLVQLKQKSELPDTFEYVSRLRERLNREFPETLFAFDTGGMLTTALNFGEPSPIHVQISGSNFETSYEIGEIIRRATAQVRGAVDVRIAQTLDYPIIDVKVDRIKAALSGLTVDDVMKNIVTATNSSINFDPAFWIDSNNGNHYFIGAQYAEETIRSLETLKDIPIRGVNGVEPVRLRNLAQFSRKTGPAVINHRNITRVIDVFANVDQGYAVGSVMNGIEEKLLEPPELGLVPKQSEQGRYYEVGGPEYAGKGYSIEVMGEMAHMRRAFIQFRTALIIAAMLVYLVMVAHFRSFLDPLIVMLTVPLGFIGVALFLYSTGTALSIQSFMGIIMMVGIVVAYSIVLVDFSNRLLDQGHSLREAILTASSRRVRPILMTSSTTILALLPMAIGWGGGDANIPLARAIVGGVIAASLASLLVVPCFYLILKREPVRSQSV